MIRSEPPADDWVVTCRRRAEAEYALARAVKILDQLGVTLDREISDCEIELERRGRSSPIGSTGNRRRPIISGRQQAWCDGTSLLNRELTSDERLGVKFPEQPARLPI
jgi:hypothetical protein